MHKAWSLTLLFAAIPAFGQLESNTVTISATRSISLQPDQALFSLSVTSPFTTSLDQVLAALSGSGITSSNLNGVENDDPKTLEWDFTLVAPLSNLAATIGSLTKLQQTITRNKSGLALTFSINGTQVSSQLQQSQSCSTSDLITDATAQAQKLTGAAGLVLGPILKLSNAPTPQTSVGAVVPGFGQLEVGRLSAFLLGSASTPVTCSLVVQFRLQP